MFVGEGERGVGIFNHSLETLVLTEEDNVSSVVGSHKHHCSSDFLNLDKELGPIYPKQVLAISDGQLLFNAVFFGLRRLSFQEEQRK